MEFSDVIKSRRSIRGYTDKPVPASVMNKALDEALLAPNSSNMQSWEFYWVKSPEKKQKLIEACLNQSAARTAQELIVSVASIHHWKRNAKAMSDSLRASGADAKVLVYYDKLMPTIYGYSFFSPLKWLSMNVRGLFRPTPRRPATTRDLQEIAIKSAALACENFMLSIRNQGFDTCPMEGMDESRVEKILNLKSTDRVVMVISVGERTEKGIWGAQVRHSRDWFIKEV